MTQEARAILPGRVIVQRRRERDHQQRKKAGHREQAHEKQATTINGGVHYLSKLYATQLTDVTSEVVDSVLGLAVPSLIFLRLLVNQKLTNLFYPVKITCMQSNKASNKTSKNTSDTAVAPVTAAATETAAKSRPAKSSKSKSESAETSSVKRHRKAAAPAAEASSAPVVESAAVLTAAENAAEDASYQPSYEQIAMLAHALWIERGCTHGCPEQDWLAAEQHLKAATATA